ncbi:hypothetical protein EJ04DRAFT_510934 [Polyplosphaeria fusca]|uniref:DUF3752 domain-containing protein n=1 Tax=Polyplosphaeria fusca TaxID=682080 RepID=A0A9P4R426_9PLEO|nr:hypothetical protein EJ04DRAFT_510934 [Polyplosphaeria fusca]
MSSIGPSLPPHLQKRKRDDGEQEEAAKPRPVRSSSPDSTEKRRRVMGPAAPPRDIGPTRPPASTRPRSTSSSSDSDVGPAAPSTAKPARVLGPAPPPAPLSERPPNPPSDDSDSSDDDFGPAPPPAGAQYGAHGDDEAPQSVFDTNPHSDEEPKKLQRDDWMSMPPTHDGLSRMDPTKARARKFNTGKSAGSSRDADTSTWTETPEQKLKRLQNEALGITAPEKPSESKKESRSRKGEEQSAKIRERLDSNREKSLVEQHKERLGKDKEDDPSRRGFDYEKDMGSGMTLGHKQKQEMLNKAKGLGNRFSSGSYL